MLTSLVGRSLAGRLASATSMVGRPSASLLTQQARNLHIHEYQCHKLMRDAGISVPNGGVAETPDEAEAVARSLQTEDMIVKAQVHTGGRGKGVFDNGFKGGVHICNTPLEVRGIAQKMLGHRLKTKQSGPEGKLVSRIFIGQRHFIRREMYFAILMDRLTAGPVLVGSSKGGVDIEDVAAEDPTAIIKEPIDVTKGIERQKAIDFAHKLGFKGWSAEEAAQQIKKLYDLFLKTDATLLEINPLAETSAGNVLCVDAKMNFDDNAEFRQQALFKLRDHSQEDVRDVAAAEFGLNYIGLDGDIGCLVNGAGLAMATMDIIKLYGGSPANFLDVGGGATEKQVTEALRLIASEPTVRAILINIFGGIMKCDLIALGIINAVKTLNLRKPLVVRLQGTNVEEAKRILEASGLRVIPADDLDDAAQKAVRVSQIVSMAEEASLQVSFELPMI